MKTKPHSWKSRVCNNTRKQATMRKHCINENRLTGESHSSTRLNSKRQLQSHEEVFLHYAKS
ncbi:rCG61330, isoform CRA_b [Rattus norvegicus]|uniref:RCG61330, isoform CRA_b n=1 Tax=Rattus norvegicus TaxID=10116 RepID=A6HAE8_RAT|nr:rCG61330, isoform CRA_b [Rattus norvegicus]